MIDYHYPGNCWIFWTEILFWPEIIFWPKISFGHKSISEGMKWQKIVRIFRIRNLPFLIALSKFTEFLTIFSMKVTFTLQSEIIRGGGQLLRVMIDYHYPGNFWIFWTEKNVWPEKIFWPEISFGHKSISEVMKWQKIVSIFRIRNLPFLIALSKCTEYLTTFSMKVTTTLQSEIIRRGNLGE